MKIFILHQQIIGENDFIRRCWSQLKFNKNSNKVEQNGNYLNIISKINGKYPNWPEMNQQLEMFALSTFI